MEHLGKRKINKRMTSFQLFKKYTKIVYSQTEYPDGTNLDTVVNLTQENVDLIVKMGLAVGIFADLDSENAIINKNLKKSRWKISSY